MPGIIVQSLEGNIKYVYGLLNKFMDVCPDDIWAKKFDGWPVWQQVCHTLYAVDFFTRPLEAPEETPLLGGEEASLSVCAKSTAERGEVRAYAAKTEERINAYIADLNDAKFAQSNAARTARMGMPITRSGTLSLIAAHTLYHLGSCGAALREHGIPGVF